MPEFEPHPVSQFVQSIRTGPTRIPWSEVPKDLRKIVHWSVPSLILLAVLLAIPFADYEIEDRPATREEFLNTALPFLVSFAVILLCVAYGIRTERLWVRPFSVAFILAGAIYSAALHEFEMNVLAWGVWTFSIGSNIWFWYGKREIADYYRRLERDPGLMT